MIGSYARISREEQSKYSISSQLEGNRKKANLLYPGEPIKEYVDDGYSGEFLDRPGLSQLREDVRAGIIKVVICYDPDRLSRKLMNQLIITEEFERRGVQIVFVSGDFEKTPEGQLFYSMRGAISEYEKAKINERMSRGRREKARQGKIVRDFQIYGYGYDKENASYYIIEEEAAVVKLIFDLFTTPNNMVRGINGIAKYLTERRVPTKRGAEVWHRQVVRQILMNRAYTGEFYQNKWNTEGMLGNKHRAPEDKIPLRPRPKEEWILTPIPAIIDQRQFEHAQRLIGESKRRFAKESFHKYLLSGLVRCGECGNTMTGRRSKNWGKYVFEYTDLKNYSGAKFRGCGMKMTAEQLDQYVWDEIFKWLSQPSSAEIAAAQEETNVPSFEESERQRIEAQLEKTRAGRKRLLKLFASGSKDIGEEEIRDMLRELKEEEEELERKLQELEERSRTEQDRAYSQKLLEDAIEYYTTRIGEGDLTFEDKQELIRHIVREVVVYKDRIEIFSF